MTDSAALPWDTIVSLGPARLASERTQRFRGETLSLPSTEFAADDRATLARTYAALGAILTLLETSPARFDALPALLRRLDWRTVVRGMQTFGAATIAHHSSPTLEAVIHDLRGGSFVALVVSLGLLELGEASERDRSRLFFLVRDHAKIMRSAVVDLDPVRRVRDLQARGHNVALLVEKWQRATHLVADSRAEVVVDCRFSGDVAERCVEFAALDRVLYNLLHNAARHASDQPINLWIFRSDEDTVRFVVANRLAPEQHARLAARFGADLGDLFDGGFTVGGTGLGMRICAEFIADVYGLRSIRQAVADGYVGARAIAEHFVTWFHWPIAHAAP